MNAAFRPAAYFVPIALVAAGLVGCDAEDLVQPPTAKVWNVPPFEMRDAKGGRWRGTDFEGKLVLVDFWSSTCGPCREIAPLIVRAHKRYAKKGLEVLSIGTDRDRKAFDAYLRKNPVPFRSFHDQGEMWRRWGVKTLPFIALVKDGKVVKTWSQGASLDSLPKSIEKHLEAKPRG